MHAYLFGSTTDSIDSILPRVRVLGIVPTLDEALEAVSTYFLTSDGTPVESILDYDQVLDANGDVAEEIADAYVLVDEDEDPDSGYELDCNSHDSDAEAYRVYFVEEYVDNVAVLRWCHDVYSGGWKSIAL